MLNRTRYNISTVIKHLYVQKNDASCFRTIRFRIYNAFNVYRRELAPGTVSLTGDRAQGDDSKHWAYSSLLIYTCYYAKSCCH